MRAPFLAALERYVNEGKENGTLIGLLLVDVGKLTQINHRFGFEQGDVLISDASEKLQGVSKFGILV